MKKIIVPPGVGDGLWVAMTINPTNQYHVSITKSGTRSLDFWSLLPFVNEVICDENLNYPKHCTHSLNKQLENGQRIDTGYVVNWNLEFNITEKDEAQADRKLPREKDPDEVRIGIYGSTKKHAWRSEAWGGGDYVQMAAALRKLHPNCKFVEIGAAYDDALDAYDFGQIVSRDLKWGATLALIKRLDGMLGFASGVPILAEYLKIPTIILMPSHLHRMHDAFCRPEHINNPLRWKAGHFGKVETWIKWVRWHHWPLGKPIFG